MSTAKPATGPAADVHKGLEGVIAAQSHLCKVDGEAGQLIYRGYDIGELAGNATYEEVSYLLFYGNLPTRTQLTTWTDQLEAQRTLEDPVRAILEEVPAKAPPMAILRTALSLLGLYDPDAEDDSTAALGRKAIRAIAKVASIVAAIGRRRNGQAPVEPKPGLGHGADFLYMLHGREPTALQAQALDTYFVLLAEHGFNASTFAGRMVTGTKSDFYSALTAAIGTLKGPLHGAANSKAMEMLLEIGSPDQIAPYVQQVLAGHKRFMGFGHRVYKGEDPRARYLQDLAKQLGQASGEPKWFTISEQLREAVWKAKQLYVNVDFYSAAVLHYLGIPTELFTTMFACARVSGWSAHIIEQTLDNRLIRPLAQYVGPRDLKFVPLEQR